MAPHQRSHGQQAYHLGAHLKFVAKAAARSLSRRALLVRKLQGPAIREAPLRSDCRENLMPLKLKNYKNRPHYYLRGTVKANRKRVRIFETTGIRIGSPGAKARAEEL